MTGKKYIVRTTIVRLYRILGLISDLDTKCLYIQLTREDKAVAIINTAGMIRRRDIRLG